MQGQGKNLLATIGYATVAVAAGIGLAMSGGLDDKSAASETGTFFKVTETKDEPKKAKKRKQPSTPPSVTCDGDQCWWTDLGRPNP